MRKILSRYGLIFIIPLAFFLVVFSTLGDYGISWDEPIHFHRGQSYLYYILTGKTKFDNSLKRSYYQNNELSAEYYLQNDDGHPPLNGILASIFNLIFYQKLGALGDIESYQLFNIIASTLLVAIVVLFARDTYGLFASLVCGLVISLYPLFFAESHFNIKDPAQTAFFTLTIWAFWRSLVKGSPKWLLLAAVGFGFSLGTKFNILFLPFILVPYVIVRYNFVFKKGPTFILRALKKVPKKYLLVLLISPLIAFGIFFSTWPFLWEDPLANIIFTLRWYKDIGTGPATFGYFMTGGFNLYAPLWILFTTPPLVLVLLGVGIIAAFVRIKEHKWVNLLWLLWFFVPILRVMVPNTTIYGGVRQIMEFLPPMSLLSGLGAWELINLVQKLKSMYKKYIPKIRIVELIFLNLKFIFLILILILVIYPNIKLHPNQNVYFNSLIGGIKGAKEKNVPYWGNSFGNAYWQGVKWLNKNAEKNAKIALIQGTSLNIPKIQLREDLRFSNSYWSGIYRDGEYLLELTHHDKRVYPYAWEYVETFLEPVFEVKIDGVAIAKVWKNDLEHTKDKFKKNEVVLNNLLVRKTGEREVVLDMRREALLTRLVVLHLRQDCNFLHASVSTSISGEDWLYEEEQIPARNQLAYREKEDLPFQTFFFAARKARFVRLKETNNSSCALAIGPNFRVYMLGD